MLPPTGVAGATFNRPWVCCWGIIVWLQSIVSGDGDWPERDEAGVNGNEYPPFCRLLMFVTRMLPTIEGLSEVVEEAEGDEGGV